MTYGYDELIHDEQRTHRRDRRSRRRKKRGFGSFIAVVLSLTVVSVVVWQGYNWFDENVRGLFSGPADFQGPGTEDVVVEIPEGATLRAMGNLLFDLGVVASSDAFVNAANANPEATKIQAGTYSLMLEMSAVGAVTALLDGRVSAVATIPIPEGLRLHQIVTRIVDNEDTEFTAEQIQAVLEAPENLTLPEYAEGSVEGFLFPATYEITANMTAQDLLQAMADRFEIAADSAGLVEGAAAREVTPLQAVTIASIVQREVRNIEDMPNVAQVIYNRLSGSCRSNGVPEGYLQMDSTVHFALDESDGVFTSDEQRQIDSPYNTYANPGIPPGPIAAPGDDALSAALNPTDGNLCYFVAVNLETGETKFAETEDEHIANRRELDAYCADSDAC